jgi:hypothetical protein
MMPGRDQVGKADPKSFVIVVPFTTFLDEAASFVPKGSKSKLPW